MRFSRILMLTLAMTMASCHNDDDTATTNSCTLPTEMGDRTEWTSSYTLFESGQVRPLAMSPDGQTLYAANTPDGRLEVYRIGADGLTHQASIPVGLEPVAVAARTNDEVWVVNHLSDSVSVVDVRPTSMRVVRTLLVGDEPSDIVFAGDDAGRAFITTAHRGQNVTYDPEFTTSGIGRADVWVFDADGIAYGTSLGGEPLTIVQLFADTPRALAVSSDGSRVYAAAFMSGNQTTVIPQEAVTANGGLPEPSVNYEGIEQPDASLIVRFDGEHWVDELDRQWDDYVMFSLPDFDVFAIDATANPPTQVEGDDGAYAGVGTVLYAMAVNPADGAIYVANTEAHNEKRFEGAGETSGSSVRGRLHDSQITILGADGTLNPIHLNKHIDYDNCCETTPNSESERSLAFPTGLAFNADGSSLYVTALGSGKLGVYATSELASDSFVPSTDNQIALSGGGPTGLVVDEVWRRIYVLTRFNNAISVVDMDAGAEVGSVPMYNPEPESVTVGRSLFYDASTTSSHGDSACASCHVFGDLDGLAWDLGNPDEDEITNPGPFTLTPAMVGLDYDVDFRPNKGPMTTQSMRGLANHGPMHWRGDRTGGNDAESVQPDGGSFDERAAFAEFNPAFEGLLGRSEELTDAEMDALTDFVLELTYPPNPIRSLDNTLTESQRAGKDFYFDRVSDSFFACNGCHVLDPLGNAEYDAARPGFFGTDGHYSFEFEPQTMKIPHLRNLYQKVGMFGMAPTSKMLTDLESGENLFMGDQVRGYGFQHDGATDTLDRFLSTTLFRFTEPSETNPVGNLDGFSSDPDVAAEERQDVANFLLAYDSNLAPIVGQQVTMGPANAEVAFERIQLLEERADRGECELVAKTTCPSWELASLHVEAMLDGAGSQLSREEKLCLDVGFLYAGEGVFVTNTAGDWIHDTTLQDWASFGVVGEVTFTCAPPGSGMRMAIDRDEDGYLDGDEIRMGSDPADADDLPSCATAN